MLYECVLILNFPCSHYSAQRLGKRMTLSEGDLLRCLHSEAVNEHVPLSETRLLSTGSLHQVWLLRGRVKMDEPQDLLEYRADIILRLPIAKESNSKNREQLARSCVLFLR